MLALMVAGCALSRPQRDYRIQENQSDDVVRPVAQSGADVIDLEGESDGPLARRDGYSGQTRVPQLSERMDEDDIADASGAPPFAVREIDTVVPPLALPAFIDLVFGEMLGVPYVTGPGVAGRSEIVQLRSSGDMEAGVFLNLVEAALADYGVRVTTENGVYQIIEDSALKARLPRFIKSRARSNTPSSLRPVVQFVELNAIDARTMVNILQQAFGRQNNNLTFDADTQSNYVILNGLPEDVNAALSIIYEMDELQYAGTQVQRYSPTFWDVRAFAGELSRILAAEGWQVSSNEQSAKPVLLLPIEYSNDLLIFTRERDARLRVNYWIGELDRPTRKGDESQLFVYSVRNLDAAQLAATVNQVLSGVEQSSGRGRLAGAPQQQVGLNPSQGQPPPFALQNTTGLVVDPLGNRLIYSGTPSEYERLYPLLQQLDQPPPEVLVEVMIAQVNLTDATDFGVDWVIRNLNDDALRFQNSASDSGSGLEGIVSGGSFGPAGVAFGVLAPDVEVSLNAFAQNNQVNVLSTPRLLARSGSSAQVQVGTDVPILTAQRAPAGAGGGDVIDVISSVEYRSTGIILQIEPIVFSDNRIDMTISQEVSSALPGGGPVASPSFSNTTVATLLSLEDGGTAVIGGLIQDNVSRSESGVPLFKDIPGLGKLFSSESVSVDRTELVILITAYVIRGQEDKTAFARKFSEEIDRTLSDDNLVTLRPRNF